jgi:hypothetical protein
MAATPRDELVVEVLRAHWPRAENDFCLITAKDREGETVNLVGSGPRNRLYTNHTYRFFGSGWTEYRGNKQFRFSDFVEHEPHSRRSVIAYLTNFPGIGAGIAGALCDVFGPDKVLGTLRQDPAECSKRVRRLTPEVARKTSKELQRRVRFEDARLELLDVFDKRGFPGTVIDQCLQIWGPSAARRIRRDPFCLLGAKVSGAGFMRVDRMYQDFGLPLNRQKRVVYLIWHTISRAGNGDTWLPTDRLRHKVADCLTGVDFPRAVEVGRRAGLLAEYHHLFGVRERNERDDSVRPWVSRRDWCDQEGAIAEDVMRLIGSKDA